MPWTQQGQLETNGLPLSTVAFDPAEELMWCANSTGQVASFTLPTGELYSSFHVDDVPAPAAGVFPYPYGVVAVAHDAVRFFAKGGLRPQLRPSWPAPFCALLTECWEADAAKRPRFADLLPRLKQIQDEVREREAASPPGGGCCVLQ